MVETYDILNAGPNSRFMADGVIVSNSGRRFQPQNIKRTDEGFDVEFALDLLLSRDADLVETFFGTPKSVISNCLRAMVMARDGHELIAADYSNIEGRVLAWLAGEEWKLQAFRDFDNGIGHDLYKMAYAAAYNKSPDDVSKDERQIGKVMELACIAEDQLVHTNIGLLPIQDVSPGIKLWDGIEWVDHDGVIYKGCRKVYCYRGLTATPDHPVSCDGGKTWVPFWDAAFRGMTATGASEGLSGSSAQYEGVRRVYDILNAGPRNRFVVGSGWLVHNCGYQGGVGAFSKMGANYGVRLPRKQVEEIRDNWRASNSKIRQFWHELGDTAFAVVDERRREWTRAGKCAFRMNGSFLQFRLPSGRSLWYAYPEIRDKEMPWTDKEGKPVFRPSVSYMGVNSYTRKWERLFAYSGLLAENCISVDADVLTDQGWVPLKHVTTDMKVHDGIDFVSHVGFVERGVQDCVGIDGVAMTPDHRVLVGDTWFTASECTDFEECRFRAKPGAGRFTVGDLMDCGSRHRFIVRGKSGPFIVHNCTQAVARDILAVSMPKLESAGYPIVLTVHDEIVVEVPEGFGSVDEVKEIMCDLPPWADGCPVVAAGWRGKRYRK